MWPLYRLKFGQDMFIATRQICDWLISSLVFCNMTRFLAGLRSIMSFSICCFLVKKASKAFNFV